MKCQRQLLGVRWHVHVRNVDVVNETGLPPGMDQIVKRRNSILGHIVRRPCTVPFHQALRCQVGLSLGRLPTNRGNVMLFVLRNAGWTKAVTILQPTPTSRCVERRCQASSSRSDAAVLDDYALTTTTKRGAQTCEYYVLMLLVKRTRIWLDYCYFCAVRVTRLTKNRVSRAQFVPVEIRKVVDVVAYNSRHFRHCNKPNRTEPNYTCTNTIYKCTRNNVYA